MTDKHDRQISRFDLVSGYMQKWPEGEYVFHSDYLELLTEREADKARIAELDSQRRLAFTACNRWADKFREAEQRIAELESRKVKLPENCEHDVIAPVMSFLYEGGYEFDREDYRAVVGRLRGEIETVLRRILRADGITLETGE